MQLVNLTPHAIVLAAPDGDRVTVQPSGVVARVSTTPGALFTVPGVPVPVAGRTYFGEVTGLPPAQRGYMFIVSSLVGAALVGTRPDVLVPGTGPADEPIRDEQGRIVAVTRLVRA